MLFYVVLLAYPHFASAQSTGFFEGKIFSKETSEPIQFASVRLTNNRLNLYSNPDGSFRIIKNSDFQSDSLVITSVSYKKYTIACKDLNESEVNRIFMTPSKSGEDKVKVTARDAKLNSIGIIRRAIGNLLNRNVCKPYNFISYYRDYQKTDSNYINLNEAIVQTIDSGFTTSSTSNIYRLLDFRKNTDFARVNLIPAGKIPGTIDLNIPNNPVSYDISRDQYGTEVSGLISIDPIRNYKIRSFSFIDILSTNFIYNHNFSPPSDVYNDKLHLLKIKFNGKTSVIGDSILVSGAIYIQPKDYSIHKLEYSFFKNVRGQSLQRVFNFDVEYGYNSSDSLMYLRYISFGRLNNVYGTDANTYFRITDSRWDIITNINPTLALSFNNKVDPVTSSQKDNFRIMIGSKEIKINNIQVVGENIYLRFKNEDVKEMTDYCEIYVNVLKDIYGNILDKRKTMEIYQYKELFVQELEIPSDMPDSHSVMNFSAIKDTIVTQRRARYWMNTFSPR